MEQGNWVWEGRKGRWRIIGHIHLLLWVLRWCLLECVRISWCLWISWFSNWPRADMGQKCEIGWLLSSEYYQPSLCHLGSIATSQLSILVSRSFFTYLIGIICPINFCRKPSMWQALYSTKINSPSCDWQITETTLQGHLCYNVTKPLFDLKAMH